VRDALHEREKFVDTNVLIYGTMSTRQRSIELPKKF